MITQERLHGSRSSDRVAALARLGVLDGGPQPDLDAVVELARAAVGMPGAAVNFFDDTRQLQAATSAPPLLTCAREDALCTLAVDTEETVHAPDTATDPRFRGNPFVTGELAAITSYAAVPVRSGGVVVATVCVFATDGPRRLRAEQLHVLELLGDQTARLLELRRVAHDLQRLALQDELTGLPNRRALPAVADPAVDHGCRTVAYLDLDGFKAVNDRGGHHVGDQVLHVVAQRLRGVVRRADVVVRMGGDEFLVVCGDEVPEAELRARLATAVDRPVVVDGRAWSVGFSAGVTTSPADEPISAAVQRADAAMYRAKARRGA